MKHLQKKLIFVVLFTVLGFVTINIPFTKLAGSNVSFTLFDFFGPIAGAFLGLWLGIVSVLTVEVINLFVKQTPLSAGPIIRLFPMLFATYYFATINSKKENRLILVVPFLAIAAFVIHPIGRNVWYYSLFWTIPLLAYIFRKNLFARSLGATFTAHAVGGAAWILAFNLPAHVWRSLIPIVIQERLLFAAGIAVSYVAIKHVLNFLIAKKVLPSLDVLQKPHISKA